MSVHGWIYDKARRAPMRFNGYLPPRTSSSCTSSVYTRCNADLPRPCMAQRDSPPPASTSDAIYVHGSVRHAVTCSGRMCCVMRVEMEDAHTHEQGNDETPTFARTFPFSLGTYFLTPAIAIAIPIASVCGSAPHAAAGHGHTNTTALAQSSILINPAGHGDTILTVVCSHGFVSGDEAPTKRGLPLAWGGHGISFWTKPHHALV